MGSRHGSLRREIVLGTTECLYSAKLFRTKSFNSVHFTRYSWNSPQSFSPHSNVLQSSFTVSIPKLLSYLLLVFEIPPDKDLTSLILPISALPVIRHYVENVPFSTETLRVFGVTGRPLRLETPRNVWSDPYLPEGVRRSTPFELFNVSLLGVARSGPGGSLGSRVSISGFILF